MHIWIFQSGEPLHIDGENIRPMRSMNLANTLIKRGHSVLLLSSSFYHQKKYHRSKTYKKIKINKLLEVFLIPSPGYKKNFSILRLIDHFILALNLKKILNLQSKLPDVAFIGYPPIETSYVLMKWLKKNDIPYLLDIKDQWPQVFVDAFPKFLRFFAYLCFFPYFILSKKIIRQSNGISTISKSFLEWALTFSTRNKNKFDIISPLTSPKQKLKVIDETVALNWWSKRGIVKNGLFKVIFIGSFSKAFDFNVIFETATKLFNKKVNCEFILCGDGELSSHLKNKSKYYNNMKIIDWIDSKKIAALVKISSAFIAPYKNKPDFVKSIPNKVIDALKFGLPLVSPLKGEVQSLIKNYKIGVSYNDAQSLGVSLKKLINNKTICKKYSYNSIKLYQSKFEFENVYGQLVLHLESLKKSER